MIKIPLTNKLQRPNARAHYLLFAENSPFKPKAVKRKDTYNRKQKHRNKEFE